MKYGASMTHVIGTWETNFEDRARDHYHWEIANHEQVAPTEAGDGPAGRQHSWSPVNPGPENQKLIQR